jgi:hypothetical protein
MTANFIFKGVHKMNITNKKIFTIILVILFTGSLLTSHMMAMATSSQPVAIAANATQLYTAMIQANDGDVIGINGRIDILGEPKTYGYADKHITFKRMSSSSYFYIQVETTFQNVTFDGDGIDAANAYVLTSGKVTFKDVNFINSITNTANGGAVYVIGNSSSFLNCTFDNNTAVQGGHMYVSTGTVTIQNSIFTNGHALSDGGAIKSIAQYPNKIDITSSIITGNSADGYGGGISLAGYAYVAGTKIYNNIAQGGGADIARPGVGTSLSMYDSLELEGLLELYQDEEFVPIGWVNDYNAEAGVEFPLGNDLTSPNVLMKLDYFYPPKEVVLAPSSLGTAADGKIIGLASGKYYKITADDVISYSKADGSLTSSEAEAEALTGSEIVGLVNGVTYMVEEYIPPVEEEPTDPDEEDPTDPVGEDPTDPIDPTDPGTEIPGDEDPKDPVDQEDPDKDKEADEDPDHKSDPSTSITNNTTNSNNTSNTTNNTTNNSTTHNSETKDESSTVNNYDHSTHTTTENTYLPPSSDGSSNGGQASATQHQTITVDYGSIVDGIKVQEDGKNITINVNVNVDTNEKKEIEDEPKALEVVSTNVEPVQSSISSSNITWIELVKICLLFGIFICVFRRPVAK